MLWQKSPPIENAPIQLPKQSTASFNLLKDQSTRNKEIDNNTSSTPRNAAANASDDDKHNEKAKKRVQLKRKSKRSEDEKSNDEVIIIYNHDLFIDLLGQKVLQNCPLPKYLTKKPMAHTFSIVGIVEYAIHMNRSVSKLKHVPTSLSNAFTFDSCRCRSINQWPSAKTHENREFSRLILAKLTRDNRYVSTVKFMHLSSTSVLRYIFLAHD